MISLKEYKDLKKLKKVHEDLTKVKALLTTFIDTLQPYKKYIQVMESLSTLQNSLTIIDINLAKFKRLIEKAND